MRSHGQSTEGQICVIRTGCFMVERIGSEIDSLADPARPAFMRLGGSRFIGLALVLRSIAPRHAVIRVAAFRGCTAASDPGCRVSVGGREDLSLIHI